MDHARALRVASAVLVAIVILVVADVVVDTLEGGSVGHTAAEALVGLLAVAGLAAVLASALRTWRAERGALETSRRDVERLRGELDQLRAMAERRIGGFGQALDRAFDGWGLTPAEQEVALLLLKGLSLVEVAAVRGTSERTARTQARAIYRKSGVAGRAELSAFFLEDLLADPPDDVR